jgi:hypothetical protein
MEQKNGNVQLNEARTSVNRRVDHKTFLGRTKRRQWAQKRRFRTI